MTDTASTRRPRFSVRHARNDHSRRHRPSLLATAATGLISLSPSHIPAPQSARLQQATSSPSAPSSATSSAVPRAGRNTAVVIGGGLAGTLAAWALHGYADMIIVIERDRYPEGPEFRAGVPQSRHAHLLLEAGHRTLEELMPGIRSELLAAGATQVAMSQELRWLASAGWMVEHHTDLAFLSATRPLLDHTVRARLQGQPSVQILQGHDVVGLLGSPGSITGVRIRERDRRGGAVTELPAELVIDASGRRSSVPNWLTSLGCKQVLEERVDAGVAYSSRLFRRPATDPGFQALYLQTKAPDQPWTGSLLPVEGDRWIVSLGGMRGAEPGPGEEGFTALLEQMRDPILRETLEAAEPAGPVHGFRPGSSVRRHYAHRGVPDGLVVLGDAAASFNPVYGQGITAAALGAKALRTAVIRHGDIGHKAARAARRAIDSASRTAWLMSSGEDARFPATIGARSDLLLRAQHRMLDRVLERATTDPAVTVAVHQVMSMVSSPAVLLRPPVLAALLRPRR